MLQGVATYGTSDWASIARQLVFRNARTVRQRYIDTLQRRHTVVRPWDAAEDEALARAVQHAGMHAWTQVAAFLQDRSAKQCSQRWYNHVRSRVNPAPWTPEEDERLRALYVVGARVAMGIRPQWASF